MEELCLNQPPEYKEFMNYCRGLSFAADPDYRYILSLFEGCMERHNFELRTPDFIWNKNRLFLERQTLKESMMRVINKPAAAIKPRADGEAGDEPNDGNNERGGADGQ